MTANSILIRLNSTGVKQDGKTSTGFFKTTRKNPKGGKGKLTKICYDPRAWNEAKGKLGKHVPFEEGKIK